MWKTLRFYCFYALKICPHPINRISTYLSTLSTGSTRYLVLILCLSISGRIKNVDKYKKDIEANLNFISYAPYLFISALTGQRVHKVLNFAKLCYSNYSKRISTGILNEVVNRAVLMKEPMQLRLQRSLQHLFSLLMIEVHSIFLTRDI